MPLQQRLNHMTFSSTIQYPENFDAEYEKEFAKFYRVANNNFIPDIAEAQEDLILIFYQLQNGILNADSLSRVSSNRYTTPIVGNDKTEHPRLLKHNYIEIIYVLSGSLTLHIEDKILTYPAGRCCIFNNNVNHATSCSEAGFSVSIILKPTFLQSIITEELKVNASHPLSNALMQLLMPQCNKETRKKYIELIPIVPFEKFSSTIDYLLERMVIEMSTQEIGYATTCNGLLLHLLGFIDNESYYTKLEKSENASNSEQIFISLTRELEQSKGRVNRKELEEKLHYSSNYLNKICNKYFGDSLVKYGQLFLLKEAESLLINTDFSVNEIMMNLGFANKSYFYHLFMEKNHLSPSQYRATFKHLEKL